MRPLRPFCFLLAALLPVAVLQACHIEDHTPAGSRRDETAIRDAVSGYLKDLNQRNWASARQRFTAGAEVDYAHRTVSLDQFLADMRKLADSLPARRQLLRLDLRQAGDLAAGWAAYRLGTGDVVAMNHFVLRRTPDGWRITHLSVARLPAGLEL
ncbi:MAG TPA: nuclear transport factor 2 family protein [Gemmatimonadales bacterium]|nr:nuclear transport factor 2 family protein [Gemmatimonadales bacterium]